MLETGVEIKKMDAQGTGTLPNVLSLENILFLVIFLFWELYLLEDDDNYYFGNRFDRIKGTQPLV
jgi:hypothetical protein